MTTYLRTTDVPPARTTTLPRPFFTSPALFDEEMEKIFGARWLCVGREDLVPKPGDYVLREVGRESILIVRESTNRVRAFYNVCRHRGTRLCEAHQGQLGGAIRCPYHAWTYALDGRLLGAPSSEAIDDFDAAAYPLHAVAVASWEGFLFINMADSPEPFADAWAPVLDRFTRYSLPRLTVARTIEYDVGANWKLILQNYSECYHCAPVHPSLAKLSPPTSGENDLFEGPFLGGFMVINPGSESLTMSGFACGVPVGELPPDDLHRVYYYTLFPNMLLSLHPDYVMVHTLWPTAVDRTRITCQWLFQPASLGTELFDSDDGIAFWDMTNRQDWHICEQSQLGVASRKYEPGPYSRRETLAAAVDREVLKGIGREE